MKDRLINYLDVDVFVQEYNWDMLILGKWNESHDWKLM